MSGCITPLKGFDSACVQKLNWSQASVVGMLQLGGVTLGIGNGRNI